MAWIDNLNNAVFEIITGDGLSYFPKWKNATKELEFNISEFNFVEVDGSYIVRKSSQGRMFSLEFYFDGENAIVAGNNFEISSRNTDRWTLKHPFYGVIKCHPVKLKQDNTQYNVSKFTVTVVETLLEGYPQPVELAEDIIINKTDKVNDAQAAAFDNNGQFNRNQLAQITELQSESFTRIIDDPDELNQFNALVEDALNTITNINSSALDVIRSIQKYINYPATVTNTVQARHNSYRETLGQLIASIEGLTENQRDLATKNEFEAVAGAIVAATYVAVTTNIDNDYKLAEDVLIQQRQLYEDFKAYITVLDENQTDRTDTIFSYTPDFDALNSLNEEHSLTIANLFALAFEAQQTRIYINEKDSNAILLCHRFYGLDTEDLNLENFININDITLNEMLLIKKGREITYYI